MKRLLCLNVELLKAFDPLPRGYGFPIPSPTLCSTFVSASLTDAIASAQCLIDEHNLMEIVSQTTEVNWFSSLDQQIYQTINSSLHVTRNSIYFSGAFAPQKEPVFVSKRLPLTYLESNYKNKTNALNLSFLKSDTAKVMIAEIESFDRELTLAWERQDSLETLDTALNELNPASLIADSEKTDRLAHAVGIEIKQLIKASERLEVIIENKCELLCQRVLGVAVGDQIVTQTNNQNTTQCIQIEAIKYYNGTLYLNGPKRLKNGLLGKRAETVSIELLKRDEHN